MSESKNDNRKLTVMALMNLVGGVSGIVSIATLVFFGGGFVEKVKALDARMSAVETVGPSPLREHNRAQEQRDSSIAKRIEDLETHTGRLGNIEMDIREIKTILQIRERANK